MNSPISLALRESRKHKPREPRAQYVHIFHADNSYSVRKVGRGIAKHRRMTFDEMCGWWKYLAEYQTEAAELWKDWKKAGENGIQ